jgi:3-oxoacyl-ACP reductase-like protein
MSVFDSIKNAIFGHKASAAPPSPAASGASAASPAVSSFAQPAPQATAAPTAQQPAVDVEAVLSGLAAKNTQKLNWQSSIVDLMKLLGLDSSLQNRTTLAKELGYTGSTADSAAMNIWLHQQVMNKLAESGGKVPASLRS